MRVKINTLKYYGLRAHKTLAPARPCDEFCSLPPNVSGVITEVCFLTFKSLHKFVYAEELYAEDSNIYRSLQKVGLHRGTCFMFIIWKRLPYLWKILGPVFKTNPETHM